jgi:thiol:disulfide interchange protein DsbD
VKILIVIFASLVLVHSTAAYGQDANPVEWHFSSKRINDIQFEVHLSASIDAGWHLYSQYTPQGGPVPTSIFFTRNPLLKLNGLVKESGKMDIQYEPMFGVEVMQYADKVDFIQLLSAVPNISTSVTGTIRYMACNQHECIPPQKINFDISIH